MDRKKNDDKIKKYNKQYYKKNKEKILEKQKEWKNNNKEKLVMYATKSRNKRIERLKEEGVINPWGVVMRGSKPKYKKESE